jgi:hypothetical protein
MQSPSNKLSSDSNNNPTNVTYPLSATYHRSGLFSLFKLRAIYLKDDGHDNFHKKFVYQSVKYLVHNPYELFTRESTFHQTITNHSLIIYLNPKKTTIDEALEGYEFGRFDF